MVMEGEEGVVFLYSDLVSQVKREKLETGQTIQQAGEAFLMELDASEPKVLKEQPLDLSEGNAYMWLLDVDAYHTGALLVRAEGEWVGIVYVATGLSDTDFVNDIMIPIGIHMLGSFRFLHP